MNKNHVDKLKVVCVVVDDAGFDTTFLGQFGLSMYAEIESGDERMRLLIDTGLTSGPLLNNMDILGIEPSSIDAIFITHCHYDHTGGLGGLLRETQKGIPVIAHPSIFRRCYTKKKRLRYIGVPDGNGRDVILARGAKLVLKSKPYEIMPGAFTTGEVERRTSYEPLEEVFNMVDGELVQDPELDDMSLVVNVGDLGLVILTGCSHAGIVNIMMQSRRLTGLDRIHSVVGGLHLRIAKEEQMSKTVEELDKSDSVCAGHCTGFEPMKRISDRMGDRFSLLQCGTTLEFGS
jgi:7,8-dihydropterin-6-yl-methyl-4-(beta-D-ribofuranosyl)aminobenzene 5'-phosphate synthase